MLENLKDYRVVLASQSPRRRELLSGLGIAYEVRLLPDIDESYPPSLKGEDIPIYIARAKAEAYLPSLAKDELLITADTIVWLDDKVLGKPSDEEEAAAMLRLLSGRTHRVMTGVAVTSTARQHSFVCTSEVTFDVLSEEEIAYYVDRFRPLDKAGSYGIQEWIGYIGVQSIRGSYFNIMGLPVQRLYRELKKWPEAGLE
jgi:septum formation protein maf